MAWDIKNMNIEVLFNQWFSVYFHDFSKVEIHYNMKILKYAYDGFLFEHLNRLSFK